jgi:hypothetical protein
MYSDVATKYLSTLIDRMHDGKEAKRELIRLARTSPEEVLNVLRRLPESDQRYLKWLSPIAEASREVPDGRR